MDAHQEGKKHAEENAAEGEPEVAQADGFVIAVEKGAGEKARGWSFRGCAAAVEVNHRECHYTPGGLRREGAVTGEMGRMTGGRGELVGRFDGDGCRATVVVNGWRNGDGCRI